ncbi:sodium/potassium/calcium exchanger 2-like isoform X3 [Lampetra fluviatilis]
MSRHHVTPRTSCTSSLLVAFLVVVIVVMATGTTPALCSRGTQRGPHLGLGLHPPHAPPGTSFTTTAGSGSSSTSGSPGKNSSWHHHPLLSSSSSSNATSSTPATASPPRAGGEYPRDLFSLAQRRRGAAVLHLAGVAYTFVALALVCDEFFVPALGAVSERLALADDVAGATFMAAGGSAPELFTALVGVFLARSNVGVGTVVGSAVFNVFFVVGVCALASRAPLRLRWRPMFRDAAFYALALALAIGAFADGRVEWWESVLLLANYAAYVAFVARGACAVGWLRRRLRWDGGGDGGGGGGGGCGGGGGESVGAATTAAPAPATAAAVQPVVMEAARRNEWRLQRGGSTASLRSSTMRSSLFQLMIHTLDPLGDAAQFQEKAAILHRVAKMQRDEPQAEASAAGPAGTDPGHHVLLSQSPGVSGGGGGVVSYQNYDSSLQSLQCDDDDEVGDDGDDGDEAIEEPMSLAWPDSTRKRAIYLLVLPIVFPLWLTLPDVRKPAARQYFVVTFLGSIVWIALFSYLMVWWAHQRGDYGTHHPGSGDVHPGPHHERHRRSQGPGGHGRLQLRGQQHLRHHRRAARAVAALLAVARPRAHRREQQRPLLRPGAAPAHARAAHRHGGGQPLGDDADAGRRDAGALRALPARQRAAGAARAHVPRVALSETGHVLTCCWSSACSRAPYRSERDGARAHVLLEQRVLTCPVSL